jgi:hypothetical protein
MIKQRKIRSLKGRMWLPFSRKKVKRKRMTMEMWKLVLLKKLDLNLRKKKIE